MGIFTELGIVYGRYRPEKLMEHLKLFSARLNIPRLIRCEPGGMCGESGGGEVLAGSAPWFLIVVPHSGATIFTHFHYLHTFDPYPHTLTPPIHTFPPYYLSPRACEEQGHWRELTYLYIQYDEYDNAAACMMTHSTTAWEHVQFKDVTVKVTNTDVHYKGLQVWNISVGGKAEVPG